MPMTDSERAALFSAGIALLQTFAQLTIALVNKMQAMHAENRDPTPAEWEWIHGLQKTAEDRLNAPYPLPPAPSEAITE